MIATEPGATAVTRPVVGLTDAMFWLLVAQVTVGFEVVDRLCEVDGLEFRQCLQFYRYDVIYQEVQPAGTIFCDR